MFPVVVLWPTTSTFALSTPVCNLIDTGAMPFRSASAYAGEHIATAQTLRDAFREMVPINALDTTLNVVVVVSLVEGTCDADVARLAGIVAQSHNSIALHVLCLQDGIAQALGTGQPDPQAERTRLQAIVSTLASQPYRAYSIVIDDYLSSGAPINFTFDLLSRFIATFLKGMIENYDALFPPSSAPNANSVMAIGIAEAKFDLSNAVNYLRCSAFVTTLENEGITQESVNINAASQRVDQVLNRIEAFYEKEYKQHVTSPLNEGKAEDEIAANIPALIEKDVDELRKRLTAFLYDNSLSLPEKEATFSLLIGNDSQWLTGSLYNGPTKTLDDALTIPLGIFIDSYNALPNRDGKLPARKECKYLRLPNIGKGESAQPNPRNEEACNPLPELKKLKAQMIDQTAFIRRKTEDLDKLRKLVVGQQQVFNVLVGQKRQFYDVVEQPLTDTYTPKEGLQVRDAVDLRNLCSPVRNQGNIGSCTSFAVTAMYEIIINAANDNKKVDLSERFLFYHSNVVNGKSQGGSNFKEQLAVMGEHGICNEILYPYNTDELDQQPTDNAIQNAQNHRVLQALQIPLEKDGSRYDNIRANHRLLTSALSEGYAIGFSLKIYNDFGKAPGGFVPLPTPPEDEQPGYHAMVIVGYSETQKCYIVRNSWGHEFGDNGYCYVASVYIDDPDFINFACIITQTTDDNPTTIITPSDGITVQFAATANLCLMAATQNTIDEAKIALAHLKEQYDDIYDYRVQLLTKVGRPEIRQSISQARKTKLAKDIADNAQLIKKKNNDLDNLNKRLNSGYGFLINAKWLHSFITGVFRRDLKRQIRQQQEEIERITRQKEQLQQDFPQTHMRFYVAGIVIDELLRMELTLRERSQSLVSYVRNLVQWYKADKQQLQVAPADRQMFITLIDRSTLNAFFENNRNTICQGIDIMQRFDEYQVATKSLPTLRNDMLQHTTETLQNLMKDFDMCPYLLQTATYPFLPTPDCDTLFNKFSTLTQVATRHNLTQLSSTALHIAIAHSPNDANALHNIYDKEFAIPPQLLNTSHSETITTFITMSLPIDSLQ